MTGKRGGEIVCWVVTEGAAGMENQCVGLAEALGLTPLVKRIRLRPLWQRLFPFLRWHLERAFDTPGGDPIAPPWPDLLIACGRPSAAACLLARGASGRDGAPRTFTVYIQNPRIAPANFDLMVVPEHDRLTGPNIVTTRGGLNRITPELLRREAEILRPRVAALPQPRVAVLIGGSSAVYRLTPAEMRPLADRLAALAHETGCGLMVTPSRRTGEDNLRILQDRLRGTPAFLWDFQGRNPYFGMLGLADAFIVTADSINLTSEACATGRPVHVVDLPGGSAKFRRFHDRMRADGFTRPFEGRLESWTYAPLDETHRVAARIRHDLEARE